MSFQPTTDMQVKCAVCGHDDFILDAHLLEKHGLTVTEYLTQHPSALTMSKELFEQHEAGRPAPKRVGPPAATDLTVEFAGVTFPVDAEVPATACLPMPRAYRVPTAGKLVKDMTHVAVALRRSRSVYVHGLPGTGKDACFHAFSWMTRTPGQLFSVTPSTDIQAWFFSRGFDEKGTHWVEGEFLKAARDGHVTPSGRRVPKIILVSDIDRADKAQAEYLRLILDSIEGRLMGPEGVSYPVLKGTIFAFTANSAGSGDIRGRCISANPIDASLLDRIERKFEFHYMDWADEEPIVRDKFPLVVERAAAILPAVGKITGLLRDAVEKNEIYCEFTHRALCAILGHAEDILFCADSRKAPANLLRKAIRAWIDGLPDPDTREAARKIIDPHLTGGALDEGARSQMGGKLDDRFE